MQVHEPWLMLQYIEAMLVGSSCERLGWRGGVRRDWRLERHGGDKLENNKQARYRTLLGNSVISTS